MNMKITKILALLGVIAAGSSAMASTFTFSDADSFGGLNGSGNPIGVTLTAGGSDTQGGSFNFVTADSTPSFIIGDPYQANDQGPYKTQLGFIVGQNFVISGNVSLFLRDTDTALSPDGGEAIVYTSQLLSQTITGGSFETQLHISQGINASVIGFINAQGFITYTVQATSGSFILDAAYMEVNAVPDGGATAMLLGVGILGLGAMRRKVS
jgi:hypothetical protein